MACTRLRLPEVLFHRLRTRFDRLSLCFGRAYFDAQIGSCRPLRAALYVCAVRGDRGSRSGSWRCSRGAAALAANHTENHQESADRFTHGFASSEGRSPMPR